MIMKKKVFNIDNRGADIGKMQVGDYNRMDDFHSLVNSKELQHDNSLELKERIIELESYIEESELEEIKKDEAINTLETLVREMQKSQTEQNNSKLSKAWSQIMKLVKDIGTVSTVVKAISQLLNIPI